MYSRSLPSKLHRPALGRLVIPRARLLHSLDAGLDSKVMLISAPAGFGKSTLVSQWLERLAETNAGPDGAGAGRAIWLNLDAGDNNLSQFLFSLSAAIENAYPATCRALTALLREQASVSVERLADTLAACIARVPGPLVTVLDDVHFVDDPAIFVCLERVVQHSPPGFHLLLITRVDPPLPLNRWRAQGALHEVRLHELSFTLAETNVFLQKQLDMPVDEELASVLHRRTEGWPVGLRLAAIALRNHRDPGEFAARFEATESRFVADYLVDEVLEQQTPAMQRFLMFTSILNGLCTGLCVAVVETDEAGARAAIEYLGRANLFLVELDPSSTQCNWHRYHHQFQSMLQSRLYERYDEQTVVSLHRKAAAWLAVHDSAAEALRHLIAVHDYEAAADLIEERRVSALNEQRFHELESWFELIPLSIIRQRPALLACQAWLFHYRLENAASLTAVRRASERLDALADALPKTSRQLIEAEILALRMALGSEAYTPDMLVEIRQVWTDLRPHLADTHSSVMVWLSAVCQWLGDINLASEIALTTFEEATGWPDIGRGRLLYSYALNHYYECNLAEAERMHIQGLRFGHERKLPLIVTLSSFGLASIARHRGQTAEAEQYYLEVARNPFHHNGRLAGRSVYQLVQLYAGQGRPERGRSLVEQFREYAVLVGRPYGLDQAAALDAYLALVCGNTAASLRWEMAGPRGELYTTADLIPLVRAHILMAEGSGAALSRAAESLQKVIDTAQAQRRWTLWLDAHVLQAVVWHRLHEGVLMREALGRGLYKAVPSGMVGAFIEQGDEMQRMLHEMGRQPEYAELVRSLLNTFPVTNGGGPATQSHPKLPVPLTERELDVLRLLADRLSNNEIAQRLVVSTHTVRNHTANIFGKLQVENRSQAVAVGREFGLIPSERERAAALLRLQG